MSSAAARGAIEARAQVMGDTQWTMRKLTRLLRCSQAAATRGERCKAAVMRRRDRKTPVRRTRTERKQLRALKDGISTAVKQLNVAHEDLGEADAFVFVCIQALRAKGKDDVDPNIVTVLSVAYDKLVLDVNRNIREALEALSPDG